MPELQFFLQNLFSFLEVNPHSMTRATQSRFYGYKNFSDS